VERCTVQFWQVRFSTSLMCYDFLLRLLFIMSWTLNTALRSVFFHVSHFVTVAYLLYCKHKHKYTLRLPLTNYCYHCSLNDRRPVSNEDDVVVLLTPDRQGLPDVERINTTLAGDDDTPVSFFCSLSEFYFECSCNCTNTIY
jgi:hypothetical protein